MFIVYHREGDLKDRHGNGIACFDEIQHAVRFCEIWFDDHQRVSPTSYDWRNEERDSDVWISYVNYYSKASAEEMFRTCNECGSTMILGYTHDDGWWCCCESCMEKLIKQGLMRESIDVDENGENEEGGFFDERINDEWVPSAIFWTTWY